MYKKQIVRERERERKKETDRQTERQTDRKRQRQRQRDRDKSNDKQMEKNRHRQWHTEEQYKETELDCLIARMHQRELARQTGMRETGRKMRVKGLSVALSGSQRLSAFSPNSRFVCP